MIMTVLDATVPKERLDDVERVFSEGMSPLPPEIVQSFLVRDTNDPTRFRLTTIWRSREDLMRLRQSGERPKGLVMFEAVAATPTLSVFDIVVQRQH